MIGSTPADAIPLAPVLLAFKTRAEALQLALTAGDDYELVFTAPAERHGQVLAAAAAVAVPVTRIGRVLSGSGVQVQDAVGQLLQFMHKGYDHFGITS